ncbi:MAG: hypothetical protein JRF69_13845 [Deltaproteobacteria bacterium]|nr:hypothetical protein [Deltaproteobacteria bacterium]
MRSDTKMRNDDSQNRPFGLLPAMVWSLAVAVLLCCFWFQADAAKKKSRSSERSSGQ